MFTGIIEELGRVESFEMHEGGAMMSVSAATVTEGTAEGDSIAVNGVCLTALEVAPDGFSADLSQETLDRSTLGGLREGSPVNLERAVTPTTRLGGHIVQGHVDGRGTFLDCESSGDFHTIRIGFPPEIAHQKALGLLDAAVTVEGISLTIAELGEDFFEVAVIPKTWEMTNLSDLKPGDHVNLETDIIAKYVERILSLR